jgi:predicted dehydrogenase
MRGWVDSIRSGAPIVSPVSDALTVARIVDSCYRSESQRGAEIEIGKS